MTRCVGVAAACFKPDVPRRAMPPAIPTARTVRTPLEQEVLTRIARHATTESDIASSQVLATRQDAHAESRPGFPSRLHQSTRTLSLCWDRMSLPTAAKATDAKIKVTAREKSWSVSMWRLRPNASQRTSAIGTLCAIVFLVCSEKSHDQRVCLRLSEVRFIHYLNIEEPPSTP
jgi:hypothetical protein